MKIISIIIIQIIPISVNNYENFFHLVMKKLHPLRLLAFIKTHYRCTSQSLQLFFIIKAMSQQTVDK